MSRKSINKHISLDIHFILKRADKDLLITQKEKAMAIWSDSFQDKLNLSFTPLFFQAFTHRSFENEFVNFDFPNYERLEFLGDSILQTWVTTKLYKDFSDSEGKLSVLRSSIVNEKSLSKLALLLNLEELILLGRGEVLSNGYLKTSLLCDVFEALIGAHFLSHGDIQETFNFLEQIFQKAKSEGMNIFNKNNLEFFDEKTQLQNIVMKKIKSPPVYKTLELSKDPSGFKYEVSLMFKDQEIMKEKTNSIRNTQKKLAGLALKSNELEKVLNSLQV